MNNYEVLSMISNVLLIAGLLFLGLSVFFFFFFRIATYISVLSGKAVADEKHRMEKANAEKKEKTVHTSGFQTDSLKKKKKADTKKTAQSKETAIKPPAEDLETGILQSAYKKEESQTAREERTGLSGKLRKLSEGKKKSLPVEEQETGLLEQETGILEPETGILEPETGILQSGEPETGILEPENGEPETGILSSFYQDADEAETGILQEYEPQAPNRDEEPGTAILAGDGAQLPRREKRTFTVTRKIIVSELTKEEIHHA